MSEPTANPAGSPKVTNLRITPNPKPSGQKVSREYERFRDLAQGLAGVPKDELAEQRES